MIAMIVFRQVQQVSMIAMIALWQVQQVRDDFDSKSHMLLIFELGKITSWLGFAVEKFTGLRNHGKTRVLSVS